MQTRIATHSGSCNCSSSSSSSSSSSFHAALAIGRGTVVIAAARPGFMRFEARQLTVSDSSVLCTPIHTGHRRQSKALRQAECAAPLQRSG